MFDDHQQSSKLKASLEQHIHKNIKKLADLAIELTFIDRESIIS